MGRRAASRGMRRAGTADRPCASTSENSRQQAVAHRGSDVPDELSSVALYQPGNAVARH